VLRGLWTLTWLEIKIFVREPLGFIGTVAAPVLLFIFLGRLTGPRGDVGGHRGPSIVTIDLPIFVAILMALSAVLSLVTIISIYREGGILKRLRATPLRPHTILSAHVIVKLLFTALTLLAMMAAGRRYVPAGVEGPAVQFGVALLFCTLCIVSMGFLIASIVPTARFAQPIGALLMYPMLGLSGLFVPIASLPPAIRGIARFLPLTYAVSLLRGIWRGDGWIDHAGDVAALAIVLLVCTALASKVFRWE
jgi:ABC-2 type transport system permease protein